LLVREAVASLQTHRFERPPRRLDEVLGYLAFDYLKDREPLVLDTVALDAAGLVPATPINGGKPPTLATFSLVHVPCRPALLLSTPQQVRTWPAAAPEEMASASIVEAVAEAVQHGHDRTGRFRTVADWLEESASAGLADAGGPLAPPAALAGTEWEALPGRETGETLVVVRRGPLSGLTWALCGILALAVWRGSRQAGRWRQSLLLLWLAVGGFGLLWLPASLRGAIWWPALAGFGVAVVWYFWSALIPAKAPPAAAGTAAAVGLFFVLALALPGRAVGPGAFTVWLIPGPPADVNKLSVLAPPELLDQLQALSHRGAQGLSGAVLLGARYEGRVARGSAEFSAEFQVHCFSESPPILSVPLTGVELLEALLDGAAAYPVAAPAPGNGYAFKVKGRGDHVLRLRFAVRLPAGAEDRELRFGVPELLASRLTLSVPGEAQYFHAVGGRGAQRVGTESSTTRLEADLGRVGSVQVRWRRANRATPPAMRVKELYLWEFQPASTRLLTVLRYAVTRGAVTALELDLPEPLEVRRLETEPLPGSGGAARLLDWHLSGTGAGRRLTLDFQGPVTEGVQVFLELVPGLAFRPTAPLPLPAPRDAVAEEGLLGYRTEGLEASLGEIRRLKGDKPEDFHGYWLTTGAEDPGPPEKAFVFVRAGGAGPFLQLHWRAHQSRARCQQELHWHLGLRQADLRATVRLSCPDEDLALLEWHLPAEMQLAEVSGPDVRTWTQAGSRLQIWMQRTAPEIALSFTGWLTRPEAAVFPLPVVRCLSTAAQTTRLRLTAAPGLRVQPGELRNLSVVPEPRGAAPALNYTAQGSDYGGSFRTLPDAGRALAGILTFVEVRERQLTYTALVDYAVPERGPRSFTLRLRHWDGGEVRLEAPDAVRRDEPTQDPTERTWALQLKPGVSGRPLLRLTGSVPLENAGDFRVPDVRLEGVPSPERWLAVAGPDLLVEEARGLAVLPEGAPALGRWPAAADRLRRAGGSAWRVAETDWSLRVRARGAAAGAGPTQVFLAERAAAIRDGQHWMHQITYWLYHEAGADLSLVLPDAADILAVTVDGAEVTPLQAAPDRLWLPLPGRSGVRVVAVRWLFTPGTEDVAAPRLALPRLEGLANPPALWTVHVPAGWELDRPAPDARSASAAGQALRRAAAYLRLSAALAPRARERQGDVASQLQAVQEGFYRSGRVAEYLLGHAGTDAGPKGESLSQWLHELRAQNRQLAESQHFEKTRAEAEQQAHACPSPLADVEALVSRPAGERGGALSAQGTPQYWQAAGDVGPPFVHLTATAQQQVWGAWLGSGWLVVLLGLAWALAYSPRWLAWVQALWPEQVACCGLLLHYLEGPLPAAVGLVALAAIARLYYLVRWAAVRWPRHPAKGMPPVAGASTSVT
jgi:hypothetical protein